MIVQYSCFIRLSFLSYKMFRPYGASMYFFRCYYLYCIPTGLVRFSSRRDKTMVITRHHIYLSPVGTTHPAHPLPRLLLYHMPHLSIKQFSNTSMSMFVRKKQ